MRNGPFQLSDYLNIFLQYIVVLLNKNSLCFGCHHKTSTECLKCTWNDNTHIHTQERELMTDPSNDGMDVYL